MSSKQSKARSTFNESFASRYHSPEIASMYLKEEGSKFTTEQYAKGETLHSKILGMHQERKLACEASGVSDEQAKRWLRHASTSFSNVKPFVRNPNTRFTLNDEESSADDSSNQSSDQEADLEADQRKALLVDDGAGDAAGVPAVESPDEDGWKHVDVTKLSKTLTDDPFSSSASLSLPCSLSS